MEITNDDTLTPQTLHIIPARIEHTGRVQGQKLEVESRDGTLYTELRGRPLNGLEIDLQKFGLAGHIYEHDANGDERITETDRVNKIINWSYGYPNINDPCDEKLKELVKFAAALNKL